MFNSLLQKPFKTLRCGREGHQDEPLSYVCISTQCQHPPLICYLCFIEQHAEHEKVLLKIFLKHLLQIQTKSSNVVPLCAKIDDKFNAIHNKLESYSSSFANPELILKTFKEYRSMHVSFALNLHNLVEKVNELFLQTQQRQMRQKLNDFIRNQYFKYFGQVQEDQWTKLNISQRLLSKKIEEQINAIQSLEKLKSTDKLNDSEVLNLFSFSIEGFKKIKVYFSQQLKPDNMTILSSVHAKMEKSGSERLIILQPCLSKNTTVKKWGIRIIKLASWIGVGVCHINQIKKANYMFNYTNTGHGNYLISSNGYSWSSYKKQLNSKFQSFTYTTGDFIIVEYNPKQRIVKFKKQSDPNQPTYQLQIQSNDDPIHPQINLTGINDQVEIVNF